jgi:hypothetical protein
MAAPDYAIGGTAAIPSSNRVGSMLTQAGPRRSTFAVAHNAPLGDCRAVGYPSFVRETAERQRTSIKGNVRLCGYESRTADLARFLNEKW